MSWLSNEVVNQPDFDGMSVKINGVRMDRWNGLSCDCGSSHLSREDIATGNMDLACID